jgi:hypothetical protein
VAIDRSTPKRTDSSVTLESSEVWQAEASKIGSRNRLASTTIAAAIHVAYGHISRSLGGVLVTKLLTCNIRSTYVRLAKIACVTERTTADKTSTGNGIARSTIIARHSSARIGIDGS